MQDSTVMGTVLPRPKSAKAALDALAELKSRSSLTGGSEDEGKFSVGKRRAPVKERYGKRSKRNRKSSAEAIETKTTVSPSLSSVPPRPEPVLPNAVFPCSSAAPPRPHPRPRSRLIVKKPLTPPPSHPQPTPTGLEDLSDLTELSSESRPPSPDIDNLETKVKPVESQPEFVPTLQQSALKATNRGIERQQKATSLSTYVWVLIDPKTWRVYNQEENEDDDNERLWWPGKTQSPKKTNTPLKVKLFGKGSKYVQIHVPSDINILSQSTPLSNIRFNAPTYVPARSFSSDDVLTSPRKKQKREADEIEWKWEAGVEEMRSDYPAGLDVNPQASDSDSDLPQYYEISQYILPSSSKTLSALPKENLSQDESKGQGTKKGKRKRKDSMDASDHVPRVDEEEDDILLQIPGELVLAKDTASTRLYWPATVEKYIPPATRKQKAKYRVKWLDKKEQEIPRSWFYTSSEEEKFSTCALGPFESQVVEVQDDEEVDEVSYSQDDLAQRSLSPEPLNPPPSSEEFTNLSIREQFAYTKNVLKAILNDEYKPTKATHDKFMKGGTHRYNVVRGACLRGDMDSRDVDRVQSSLLEWCLRDERRAVAAEMDDSSQEPGTVANEEKISKVGKDIPEEPPLTEPSLNEDLEPDVIMPLSSPPPTEALFSSPPQMPPSSHPTSTAEISDTEMSPPPLDMATPSISETEVLSDTETTPPSCSLAAPSICPTEPITTTVGNDDLSELTSVGDDPMAPGPGSKPRQRGCSAFESLSPLAKGDYCINVLLPEAIRQILLWRSGDRKSVDLLSLQQEEDLFAKGEALLETTDWVFDVMRLRKAILNRRKNKNGKASLQQTHLRNGSSSTRSRRNVTIPNYKE